MLHRAATAAHLPVQQRSVSPRSLRAPDFREGSILEEREPKTGRTVSRYRVGPLLGRGGFAKCYEFTDMETGNVVAGKVIERASLSKPKTLSKLHSEIAIHKRMKHRNIVNFLRTFQDDYNVYIVLEKCSNQTLMEVQKWKRRFSVAETQHIMLQSISAMQYMHESNVIHRDLKLGNMMLDDNMNVKIGDFGLAAELMYEGERKRTICGTPNYIAPEILEGAPHGHSFEADIWSLGVIMYTLLVGEPPFQTSDVKTTYNRIKLCRYTFPPGVDVPESAKNLIHRILQSNPQKRLSLVEIRADPFFREPAPPTCAPVSMFPSHLRRAYEERLQQIARPNPQPVVVEREPLRQLKAPTMNDQNVVPLLGKLPQPSSSPRDKPLTTRLAPPAPAPTTADPPALSARTRSSGPTLAPRVGGWCAPPPPPPAPQQPAPEPAGRPSAPVAAEEDEENNQLAAVHDHLHRTLMGDYDPTPAAEVCAPPSVWVTDYADFSSKYGLSYKLSTGHTGVHFNDSTKMVWEPITNRVEYYARVKEVVAGQTVVQDSRSGFHMDSFPEALNKKVTLIKYFKSYLAKAKGKKDGVEVVNCSPFTSPNPVLLTEPNMVSDMIYVKRWLLTNQAMIFRLSNKIIQVCFFDHTEVILSSETKVVTFTDRNGRRKTTPLSGVSNQNEEVATRLKYTKELLSKLINNKEI